MPTHSTSIEAINWLRQTGHLNKKQLAVYNALLDSGPKTGTELDVHLDMRNAHRRLTELKMMKYVSCVGSRPCTITGRRAMVFQARLDLPDTKIDYTKPKQKESNEQLKRKVAILESKISVLEADKQNLEEKQKEYVNEIHRLRAELSLNSGPKNLSLF